MNRPIKRLFSAPLILAMLICFAAVVDGSGQLVPEAQDSAHTSSTSTWSQWPMPAPGLRLPLQGDVWALDHQDGQPVLVRLRYLPTIYNQHTASNFFKEQAAPFLYRPKGTVEIAGATARVCLHDLRPVIFLRRASVDTADESEDATQSTNAQTELSLIQLMTKKNFRIVSDISYAPWGGGARRSADAAGMDFKILPGNEWIRWQPKQDLLVGEYGIAALPRGQNLFPDHIYDFAINPAAPPNPDAIKPTQ